MKIFISSVRRALEEERDALPGLISAIGHRPLRFEDFTAQPTPSREACLAGLAQADAYLLILGPNYGHRFADTGQSPTHDEWVTATSAGLPRLVYRKDGVEFEPDQQAFIEQIGEYTSGVFYDSFSTTGELLTKVAAKIRELDQAGSALVFAPLTTPAKIVWRRDFDEQLKYGRSPSRPMVELHVLPVGAPPRSTRLMTNLADSLAGRLRDSRMVDPGHALRTDRPERAVLVSIAPERADWTSQQTPRLAGVRVSAEGQVSVWGGLPGDSMGAILDPTRLPEQVADWLRLIGALRVIQTDHVAIGVGVDPAAMLSTGRVEELPRQSARIRMTSDQPISTPPDELVSIAALDAGALEAARPLVRALIDELESRH